MPSKSFICPLERNRAMPFVEYSTTALLSVSVLLPSKLMLPLFRNPCCVSIEVSCPRLVSLTCIPQMYSGYDFPIAQILTAHSITVAIHLLNRRRLKASGMTDLLIVVFILPPVLWYIMYLVQI